ncbi:MAG: NUDIX hydrolase [Planctomycetota bacterium]
MHRQPLLTMLDVYARATPEEAPVAARIRRLVESHSDCFDRDCRPGHVTGSAWVLSADRRRCLLLHHRKLDRWVQPGGHADGDPDVLGVAIKEATEESGLEGLTPLGSASPPFDLDVHLIPARHAATGELIEDAHEHHDVRFLLVAPTDAPPVVCAESNDVRWCTPGEVASLTQEESVLRLLRKSSPYLTG